ncbi:MAG: DUF2062 domain-containing protein [Formosimonas sp.]
MKIKHWFRSLEPRAMALLHSLLGDRLHSWLDQHDVLNFGRHPMAKGVAFGLLCGLLPLGPVQMGATLLMCIRWRGNAMIGALTTLYSNALTIVPLYMLAFQIGRWVLPGDYPMPDVAAMTQSQGWLSGTWDWLMALGWPLIVGLPVLGLALAVLGYALVQLVWLWPVYWRARRRRVAASGQ